MDAHTVEIVLKVLGSIFFATAMVGFIVVVVIAHHLDMLFVFACFVCVGIGGFLVVYAPELAVVLVENVTQHDLSLFALLTVFVIFTSILFRIG